MSWQCLGLFAGFEIVLCLTPGPAVLLILSQALGRGRPAAFWSSLGILAGNTFYFALSATSLGAVLMASWSLFVWIKYAGAAWLVWLGLREILDRSGGMAVRAASGPPSGRRRLILNGFLLQAANPKALLFFAAVLPLFIVPEAPVAPQLLALWLVNLAVEMTVLSGYGVLAAEAGRFARVPRFARATNIAAGSLLVSAGIGLAALRR
jgi:homoserine/homoserine lactone efflux protein